MNGKWQPFLMAVLLVIGFPRLVYGIYLLMGETEHNVPEESTVATLPADMTIQVLSSNGVLNMELDDYLVGVLLAEIPGQFHPEAQKAQAVVARTYALRTVCFKDKHERGAICTEASCCQGYVTPGEYFASGGSAQRVDLAKYAVTQTAGLVMTYNGAVIDATYFSCSGGQTEDALAVWGIDVPYLQSVSSPGEEGASHYWDSKDFSSVEFQKALGTKISGTPAQWFGETTYTRGGGVEYMAIGGEKYSGTKLREMLGLRSTAFSITVRDDQITITTKGFGHRVGMSQYGAQAMASSGNTFEEILQHYYPGTVIDKARDIG